MSPYLGLLTVPFGTQGFLLFLSILKVQKYKTAKHFNKKSIVVKELYFYVTLYALTEMIMNHPYFENCLFQK